MKIFQMEKDAVFPLDWEGDIILKRPCSFTEEEYKQFFNEQMISLQDLNRYMSEPDFSIFHRVPVWVLKDEYKNKIKDDILNGQRLSDNEGFPKWTLDYRSRDERGDYWDFSELKQARQKNVIEWMLQPKNGICKGNTLGVATVNYRVKVDDPMQTRDGLVGQVTLDCSPKPEECQYIYDGETVELQPLGNNHTVTTLPPIISDYHDDICMFVQDVCEEIELNSLDDILDDAEQKQSVVPVSEFRITDDYWER